MRLSFLKVSQRLSFIIKNIFKPVCYNTYVKIGLYDPYLDTLGGGEKYIFDIALCLADEHDVVIFWDNEATLEKAETRFRYDLSILHLTENIFSGRFSTLQRALKTRGYDIILFLSDGSIPFLFARKNFLLFHHPVNWVNGRTVLTRIKLRNIDGILCYSSYVKKYLDKTFPITSSVLPPTITVKDTAKRSKKNVILSVGRYTRGMNTKKQEFLIDTFKNNYKKYFDGWKLILIGSVLPPDEEFVSELQKRAEGADITVLKNVSFEKLHECYAEAKIYWHAAGFGEDLEKFPEYAEHFGITTVEAMGYGVVPVVINAGGQAEIVEDKKNGLLWNSVDELIEKTSILMKNKIFWQALSKGARERAVFFSRDRFCRELHKILT